MEVSGRQWKVWNPVSSALAADEGNPTMISRLCSCECQHPASIVVHLLPTFSQTEMAECISMHRRPVWLDAVGLATLNYLATKAPASHQQSLRWWSRIKQNTVHRSRKKQTVGSLINSSFGSLIASSKDSAGFVAVPLLFHCCPHIHYSWVCSCWAPRNKRADFERLTDRRWENQVGWCLLSGFVQVFCFFLFPWADFVGTVARRQPLRWLAVRSHCFWTDWSCSDSSGALTCLAGGNWQSWNWSTFSG